MLITKPRSSIATQGALLVIFRRSDFVKRCLNFYLALHVRIVRSASAANLKWNRV